MPPHETVGASREQGMMGLSRDRALSLSVHLDHLRLMCLDAMAVCEAAAGILPQESSKQELHRARGDHERHASEIADVIQRLDADAIDADEPSALASYLIGKIKERPDDPAHILLKVKLSEELLGNQFTSASQMYAPDPIISMINHAAEDLRHHFSWVTQALETARAQRPERAAE